MFLKRYLSLEEYIANRINDTKKHIERREKFIVAEVTH